MKPAELLLLMSRSQNVKQRHRYIREFQQSEPRSKVFVVTMKTGSVGVTLTAATRVYAVTAPPSPTSASVLRF
jgi:SNF2 family DNA or RNA helicase